MGGNWACVFYKLSNFCVSLGSPGWPVFLAPEFPPIITPLFPSRHLGKLRPKDQSNLPNTL